MKQRLKSNIMVIGFMFFLLGLTSCAYVDPFIQDVNIVPVQDEIQLGEKMSQEIPKTMKISTDANMNAQVNAIGARLVASLPASPFKYQFHVVEDASPNAFTIPGGTIYVHTGLFKFASSQDEIAGVLAHELGHAYERHPAKGLSRAYGVEYLSALLFGQNQNKIAQLALQAAKGGVLNSFSRNDESEADAIGYGLLRKSGYAEDGLEQFLRKLEKYDQGGISKYFSTHPPSAERVARLEALRKKDSQTSSAR